MDIVLLQSVDRLGAEGDVVCVKPGYARNYLIPSGLAAWATVSTVKAVEETKRRRQQKIEKVRAQAETLKGKLEGRSLTMKLTLGEDDKPFGAISPHDIVEALGNEGLTIEKHALHLEEPIKRLGIFEIPVRLHPEVTATLKVWVVKA